MNGIFKDLEDEAKFSKFISDSYSSAADEFIEGVTCSHTLDEERVNYAYNEYKQNISKFAVLLHSSNPDQYKRAGALLHSLISSRLVSDLSFFPCKEDIEGGLTRIHYGDGKYAITQIDFYEAYHSELLAFDVAYRCCASYEEDPVVPSWDYIQNVCFYLSRNSGRGLDTFFMLFKSLMFRPN